MGESFKMLILEPHYLGNSSDALHHRTLQLCPKNRPDGLSCQWKKCWKTDETFIAPCLPSLNPKEW